MNKPHPLRELISAWADGAKVQLRYEDKDGNVTWTNIANPMFSSHLHYRIEPGQPQFSHLEGIIFTHCSFDFLCDHGADK